MRVARGQALKRWIDKHYGGVIARFIDATTNQEGSLNQGEISLLIAGEKSFSEEKCINLENRAKMPRGYLLDAWREPSAEEAPPLRDFEKIPVVGEVQGGDDGYLHELEYPVGFGDGHINFPRKDNTSYALRVRGDSMTPRIKEGEYIIAEPLSSFTADDNVVVIFKDGRKMVKVLLYFKEGKVILGSINKDHENISVPQSDIEEMHYVAAIVPKGAFRKD